MTKITKAIFQDGTVADFFISKRLSPSGKQAFAVYQLYPHSRDLGWFISKAEAVEAIEDYNSVVWRSWLEDRP